MRLVVTLNFVDGESASHTRSSFWAQYWRTPPDSSRSMDPSVDASEDRLREHFCEELERAVNDDLRSEYAEFYLRDFWRRSFSRIPKIKLKFVRQRYASLQVFLNAVGIDNAFIMDLVFEAIEAYAPQSLNKAVGGTAKLQARVVAEERGAFMDDRTTAIKVLMSGSLLIPVILALAICYVAYEAMLSERHDLRAERSKLLSELSNQNTQLSNMLIQTVGTLLKSPADAPKPTPGTKTSP